VDGYVSEASGENIFIVTDGVVKTTPLPTVLAGITRQAVLKMLADLGIPSREERFTRDEVYLADEAFFTGTAAEVTPIRELDDRQGRRRRSGRAHEAAPGALLRDRARQGRALPVLARVRLSAGGLSSAPRGANRRG
jgi:branched-subunit amino acid aminotransferase/4-amino-4-deoxychorismate lyase